MKRVNFVKMSMFLGAAFVYSNTVKAERIINWTRDNGGRNGYKIVNQTYNGQTSPGNNAMYTINCQDPGREACKFQPGIVNINNIDDWAVVQASAFFDGMNDDIDVSSATQSSGTWSKTIVSNFQGNPTTIYITTSWTKDHSGITKITTTVNPVASK